MQYQEFFYKELIEFLADDQSKKKCGNVKKDDTDQKTKEEIVNSYETNSNQICDNGKLDDDGNVIEPGKKRQRVAESGADGYGVKNVCDPFDEFMPFDVIISDKFMLSEIFQQHSKPFKEQIDDVNNPESQQNNQTNHAYLFHKINKLIIHMNNMNEEEA